MPQNPQNPDPVVNLLLRSPLSPQQRRAASEAFSAAANEDDLAEQLTALKLPKRVSADLWDLKASSPPQPSMEQPQGPEGSAIGRFASGVGESLNPITMAKGLYNTVRHPIDTASGILSSANDQRVKAHQEFDQGNYGQGAARSIAAALPIVGPMAADIGEQIGQGDIAGGAGRATGLVAPMVAGAALRKSPANNAIKADALEREAVQQVAQKVLSPKDRKYQPLAQEASKELLKRGVQGDRTAIQQWADDLISDAQTRMDEAIDKYPESQTLKTKPIVDELNKAIDSITFKGPKGAQVNPSYKDLHGQLGELKAFVEGRGDDMSFADMRRLRQQLDTVSSESGAFAKASGDRSLSASQQATMDTANAIRRQIAAERPELAAPNADMHLGLALKDILDPVKGRPSAPPSATTGATGGLHTTAAIIGSSLSNIPVVKAVAAYVASDVIPKLREAQVSPQNQLRLAQDKFKLAQALKAGQAGKAQGLIRTMASYVPGLSGVGRITEPSTGGPR